MNWQKWVIIAFLAVAAFANILSIGKPRKPTTPGIAAAALVLQLGLIALVVTA